VWAVDSIVILSGVCVGCGQHCNSECCVWAVESIVILSDVCVGCGQHCDNKWWCVCGLWKALCY
jgi:hypothetical protein